MMKNPSTVAVGVAALASLTVCGKKAKKAELERDTHTLS